MPLHEKNSKQFTVDETLGNEYCLLCGKKLCTGDVARWVYTDYSTDLFNGSFFVCKDCDDDDSTLLKKAVDIVKEFYSDKFNEMRERFSRRSCI